MHQFIKIAVATFSAIVVLACAQPANAKITNPIQLSVMAVKATADLGTVTFDYQFKSSNRSESVGVQIYAHRTSEQGGDDWPLIPVTDSNGGALVIQLYRGLTSKGTFTAKMSAGNYGDYRLLFFDAPDGHNPDWTKPVFDSSGLEKQWGDVNLHLTVKTSQVRLTDPTLVASTAEVAPDGSGTFTVKIPAVVEIPATYTGTDSGFWAMAKGTGGFSQVWADMKSATDSGDPNDHFRRIPVMFQISKVKAGIFNVNFGLFHPTFGDAIVWEWPGMDFEAGGDAWVNKAPAENMPPCIHVKGRKFVTDDGKPYNFYPDQPGAMTVGFVRGGNYGNTLDRDIFPKLDTPGYFIDLHDAGCRYVRVVFTGDRYANEPLYQHAVDQVVQNIMAAGVYPIITPQGLPTGSTIADRVAKGLAVVEAMAHKYSGQPVWIEVDNEPHEFDTWAAWKPVAEKYVKAVRAIDPSAFVIVPLEGWSKDANAAAADPITDTHVDLYDGHAYIEPTSVPTAFGAAGKTGLPIVIGEYGGNAEYLHKMDLEFQAEGSALMAVSPWAFTVAGQDKMPLVKDGETAVLQYTEAGQAIANDFAKWNEGKRVPEALDTTPTPAEAAAAAQENTAPTSQAALIAQSGDNIVISKRAIMMVAIPAAAGVGVAVGVAYERRRWQRKQQDP